MRSVALLLLAFALSAHEQPEPQDKALAVIERAMKAHGGADRIKQLRVAEVKYTMRGTMPFLGNPGDVDVTIEETYQLPLQIKKVINGKENGKEFSLAWAINGEKWWYVGKDGKTVVRDEKKDVEGQHRPFIALEYLVNHREFEWSEVSEKDGKLTALRAKSEDEDFDYVFRFDKTNGLLVGLASKRVLPKATKETDVEWRLEEYKEIGGVKLPMKHTVYHDGKKACEIHVKQVRFFEKLDERVFVAP